MISYLTAHASALRARMRQSRLPGVELIEIAFALILITLIALFLWTGGFDWIKTQFQKTFDNINSNNPLT